MGHNKNGTHLEIWVTARNSCHSQENGSQLDKWVIRRKMGQGYKIVTAGEMGHS